MTKPRDVKRLQGTLRRCRDNPNSPRLPIIRPAVPSDRLSAEGAKVWPEIVATVNELGCVTAADIIALEAMTEALADLRAARAALAEPLIIEDAFAPDGRREVARANERFYWSGSIRRQRPELTAIASAERRFAAWGAKFGLSPVDRQRVAAAPADGDNPFERF